MVFNLIYARALRELRILLREEGVILKLGFRDSTDFLAERELVEGEESKEVESVEATFVDDEALAICTSFPDALNKCFITVMKYLLQVFDKHGFKISFGKGNTEALILYGYRL